MFGRPHSILLMFNWQRARKRCDDKIIKSRKIAVIVNDLEVEKLRYFRARLCIFEKSNVYINFIRFPDPTDYTSK